MKLYYIPIALAKGEPFGHYAPQMNSMHLPRFYSVGNILHAAGGYVKASIDSAFSQPSDIMDDDNTKFSPAQPLQQLILMQNAQGYWNLDDKLADILEINIDELNRNLKSLQQTPTFANLNERTWATALSLAYLNVKHSSDKGTWELLADKGLSWLSKNFNEVIQIQKNANEFLIKYTKRN